MGDTRNDGLDLDVLDIVASLSSIAGNKDEGVEGDTKFSGAEAAAGALDLPPDSLALEIEGFELGLS